MTATKSMKTIENQSVNLNDLSSIPTATSVPKAMEIKNTENKIHIIKHSITFHMFSR